MKKTKLIILGTIALGGIIAGPVIVGCSTDQVTAGPPAPSLGNISIGLVVGAGVSVNSVTYTITGPGSFSRTGIIDVSASSTVNALISGIPLGSGYQISIKGTTTDGGGVCLGSGTFDITSTTTVTVLVNLTCNLQPQTGSILVNGTIDACPRIDALGASPAEAAVGGSIALTTTVVDVDHGPSPLSYTWTASSGTLAGANTASATLTCTKGRHGHGEPGGL